MTITKLTVATIVGGLALLGNAVIATHPITGFVPYLILRAAAQWLG